MTAIETIATAQQAAMQLTPNQLIAYLHTTLVLAQLAMIWRAWNVAVPMKSRRATRRPQRGQRSTSGRSRRR
jgi:hypothetical protein